MHFFHFIFMTTKTMIKQNLTENITWETMKKNETEIWDYRTTDLVINLYIIYNNFLITKWLFKK